MGEKFQPALEPAAAVTQVTSEGIPLLSDIPILGRLFKRAEPSEQK